MEKNTNTKKEIERERSVSVYAEFASWMRGEGEAGTVELMSIWCAAAAFPAPTDDPSAAPCVPGCVPTAPCAPGPLAAPCLAGMQLRATDSKRRSISGAHRVNGCIQKE